MAQQIKLKRSAVAGRVPNTSSLALGEIAVNTEDGKLFFQRGDNTIQSFFTTNALITGSLQQSGSDSYFLSNVGIGTDSPAYRLHVDSGTLNTVAMFNSSDANAFIILSDSTTNSFLRSENSKFYIANSSTDSSTFNVDLSSGNVGIGTTTPAYALDVSGSGNFTDGLTVTGSLNMSGSINLTGDQREINILGDDGQVALKLYDANAGATDTGRITWYINGTNYGSIFANGGSPTDGLTLRSEPNRAIVFKTNGNFDRMIIQQDGNVGIGTTTPQQALTVEGNISASGAIYDNAGSAGTSGQMILSTGTGFEWADNVAESAQDLIIQGKNKETTEIQKGMPLYFSGSGTSGNIIGIYEADAGNPDRMPAGGVAAETIASDAEGNVYIYGFINGVDTSAFNAGDDVFVAVGGGYTNVKPTGSALIQKLGNVEKVDASNGSGVIQGPSWYNDLPNWEEGKIMVGRSDGQPVTSSFVHLDESNGRLGIGTTTPNAELEVKGNIRLYTSTNTITFLNQNVGLYRGGNNLKLGGYDNIIFEVDNNILTQQTERMRLTSAGDLGIGTTSPSEKLHVTGSVKVEGGTLLLNNGDNSVYIGDNTGLNDDKTNNYNVGIGPGALADVTSGTSNIAIGRSTLADLTTGDANVAVGPYAASLLTTTDGTTAIGASSQQFATSGKRNTSLGYRSLHFNETGEDNVVIGYQAQYTSSVSDVVMVGYFAGYANVGSHAVGVGFEALENNASAYTVGIGREAGKNNTGTGQPVFMGWRAGINNTGNNTVGIGPRALFSNSGANASVLGSQAGYSNTADYLDGIGFAVGFNNNGSHVVGMGYRAIYNNSGIGVIGIGREALSNNSGSYNTALGYQAGYESGTVLEGGKNTFLGDKASYGTSGSISNSTAVGADVKLTDSNTVILGNNANVGIGTTSPQYKLDVSGSARIDNGSLIVRGTNSFEISSESATGATFTLNSGIRGYTFANNNGNLVTIDSTGNMVVEGSITAQEFHTEFVSASIIYQSGSTKFGDTLDDQHSFTGSVNITGSLTLDTYATNTGDYDLTIRNRYLDQNQTLRFRASPDNSVFGPNIIASKHLELASGGSRNIYLSPASSKLLTLTSTQRVGIGTTSPGYKFHVDSGGSETVAYFKSSDNRSRILISDDDTNVYVVAENGMASFGRNANLNDNNLNVNSSGNVGIGETNPEYRLDIQGDSPVLRIADNNTVNSPSASAIWMGENGLSETRGVGIIYDGQANSLNLVTSDNGSLIDSDPYNAVKRLTVLESNGNVGIGTTSPLAKLHLFSNTHSDFLDNGILLDVSGSDEGEPAIAFRNQSDMGSNYWIAGINQGGGNFDFAYGDIFSSANTKVRFTSDGKVGIGTTNPSKLFTVAGESQFTGEVFFNGGFDVVSGNVSRFRDDIPLHFGGNRVFELVYDSISDKLEFNSGSNPIMTLDGDGNLVVEGSITAQEFKTEFVSASIIYRSGSTKFGDTDDDVHSFTGSVAILSGSLDISSPHSQGLITFQGDSSKFIRSTTANNLQIGTQGTIQLYSNTQILSSNALRFANADNGANMRILNSANSGNNALSITDGSTTRMYISGSGNVGIGTTSPTRRLDVRGSGIVSANFEGSGNHLVDIRGDGDYNGIRLYDAGNHKISMTYIPADNNLQFGTNWAGGSEIMVINTSTGNVGIGTTTPNQKLQVQGGDVTIRLDQYGDTQSYGFGNPARQNDAAFLKYEGVGNFTGDLHLGVVTSSANVPASEILTIYRSGDVGIGTTTPSTKLEVSSTGANGLAITEDSSNASLSGRLFFTNGTSGEGVALFNVGGDLSIRTGAIVNNTTGTEYVRLSSAGSLKLNNYGSGTNTGIAAYTLGVDSSGNIIEVDTSNINAGENTDVDTGTEVVDSFSSGSISSAFTRYLVKDGTNYRAGELMIVWDESGNIEYTDVSTRDIGSTEGVLLFAEVNGADIEVKATVPSDNWIVRVSSTLL